MAAAADSINERPANVGTGRLSLEQIDVPAVNKAPSSNPSTEYMTEADLEAQPPGHEEIKHESPLHRTATAQDWTGPDDPENPWNWPSWKKVYHTSIPAFMGLAATLGSSIYTPGLPDIMAEFHISSEVALLGLALWVLGLGFGPVLAAPLSETEGRRAVYRLSLPISAVFTLGAGFAQSPAALLVLRFFGGMFASPVLAVGAGTLADLYTPLYRAPATVMFIASPFAGPALGPVIGM
jgi:Major Facilitator Superfamily